MSTKPCEASGTNTHRSQYGTSFPDELEACLPGLRARALKLCLNRIEAEDLVQDAVLRALRFQAGFTPGTNLRAWSQQILFSVFISRCRRRSREQQALESFRMDPNAWPRRSRALLITSNLPPRLHRALRALPEKFRSVVHLVDLNDLSYREAAEVLGVPVGTVMSRLFRGRRQLAQTLDESTLQSVSPTAEAA